MLDIAGSLPDYDFLDGLVSSIPKRAKAMGGTGG